MARPKQNFMPGLLQVILHPGISADRLAFVICFSSSNVSLNLCHIFDSEGTSRFFYLYIEQP